jgi:CTP:molybdopterin cytidylyltransferase MocA
LILAGGEGSRFGGPKAWAELPDGRTFLEACTASLHAAGAKTIVATLPPGSSDPSIDGLTAIPLPDPRLDMFGSLRIGLGRLSTINEWDRVAILPVDHPLVQGSSVVALAAGDYAAAVPISEGTQGHPVVVCRDVAESIADGRAPGPTLRDVLASVVVVEIPVDDPGVIANCNTPDALAAAWTRIHGD